MSRASIQTELGLEIQCSKCRDYWPADPEFFYPGKDQFGFHSWCKACYDANRREKRQQPSDDRAEGSSIPYEEGVSMKTGSIDQIRHLIAGSPAGITRKTLIERSGLSENSVDCTIFTLIKRNEAERIGYGEIRALPDLKAVPPCAESTCAPHASAETEAPALAIAPVEPDADESLTEDTEPAEIDFAVYSDGRLAIVDGDEILVLPPEATRRLGYFLGCLEKNAWPPRLDPQSIPA